MPLVEAVTEQDWYQHQTVPNTAAAPPQTIMLFATPRTVASQVFETELHKRAPHIQLVSESVPQLVTMIESNAPIAQRQAVVRQAVKQALRRCLHLPSAALLGCTHYPLALNEFQTALPDNCPIYDQPQITTQRLLAYLQKRPEYLKILSSLPQTEIRIGVDNNGLNSQSAAVRMTMNLQRATPELENAFSVYTQLYSTAPWAQIQWLLDYLANDIRQNAYEFKK